MEIIRAALQSGSLVSLFGFNHCDVILANPLSFTAKPFYKAFYVFLHTRTGIVTSCQKSLNKNKISKNRIFIPL